MLGYCSRFRVFYSYRSNKCSLTRPVGPWVWPDLESSFQVQIKIMKSASKKRSTQAIKLLVVSSAFILQGCRPRKEEELAQPEILPGGQPGQPGQQIVGQPIPTQPRTATGSSWGYNPFFWGYGSGYGRSWSSSSSNRSNSGFFAGSGPASHFGAKNSSYAPASSTVHTPSTHTSTSHVASSPSVSRGGFGSHVSSASS